MVDPSAFDAVARVVGSKAGGNMNEVSRNAILGLIDSESGEGDDALNITFARLLGALIKVLPAESAAGLIKSRVLPNTSSNSSVLALNAVLAEAPEALINPFEEQTRTGIAVPSNGNSLYDSSLTASMNSAARSTVQPYATTKEFSLADGRSDQSRRKRSDRAQGFASHCIPYACRRPIKVDQWVAD